MGEDLIGVWRWHGWLEHSMREGSTRTGIEARKTCERLLAEYQEELDNLVGSVVTQPNVYTLCIDPNLLLTS